MKIFETDTGDLTLDYGAGVNFANFLNLKNFRPTSCLYKYTSVSGYTIDSLINGYLWFSKPLDFNDPYDCLINLNYSSELKNHEDWIRFPDNIEEIITSKYPNAFDSNNIQLEGEINNVRKYNIDLTKIIQKRDRKSTLRLFNHWKHIEFLETFNKTTGVCCFTADPLNILMWSHYSSNHKGICLKFRTTKRSCFYESQYPVQYLKFLPKFVYKKNNFANELKSYLYSIYAKSDVWSYEGEWRNVKTMHNGKIEFDKKDLMEIIFGVNASNEDIDKIVDCLSGGKYQNVKLKRIKMDFNNYKLSIHELYRV